MQQAKFSVTPALSEFLGNYATYGFKVKGSLVQAVLTHHSYNQRVPVIQVVPITAWRDKKRRIVTNVELGPDHQNGLVKTSIADCLQTRPVDHRHRLVKIRGKLGAQEMQQIDAALWKVFAL